MLQLEKSFLRVVRGARKKLFNCGKKQKPQPLVARLAALHERLRSPAAQT
jgi:hypothetical protein